MAEIVVSVVGGANLKAELQRAIATLELAQIEAEGKALMVYAVLTVEDADCEAALLALHRSGIRANRR